nr:ABC transporter ATP-binding protein [uncultured Lachnoclostridium sp.]
MKIELQNVSKSFSKNTALANVSLEIDKGIFGLLGRNGAGKTTMMRLISNILRPDEGKVLVDGKDINAHEGYMQSILGYLPQNYGLYPYLTAYETLDYFARLKGITSSEDRRSQINQILKRVGLIDKKNVKISKFSGGMKQRIGIAQAVLGNPKVIIVDEPTAGLDPEERMYFKNILAELAEDKIIILSTHIVSDVEDIGSRLAIINEGKLIFSGSTNTLIDRVSGLTYETVIPQNDVEKYRKEYCIVSTIHTGNEVKMKYVTTHNLIANSKKVTASLIDSYIYSIGGLER